jgi:hypothetical protein
VLAAGVLALTAAASPRAAYPQALGTEFQINTYTSGGQQSPSLAMDADGDFVVAWSSFNYSGTDTSFESIQGQRFSAAGAPVGAEFQVNTYTTLRQSQPSVAMNADGDFVVTWRSGGSSGSDTSSYSIQGQRFSSGGAPVGAQFQVNTYTTGDQAVPSVAMDADGDFVVAWHSFGSADSDTSGWSIQGQRFSSSGAPLGAQFQVNTYTTGGQLFPSVAMDADGDFVVAWHSFGSSGTDTSYYSIQGQRFSSSGAPVGAQFQVNTYTAQGQYLPSVAMDADGDFVVAWQSSGSSGGDTSTLSIQGQRFSYGGAPVGGQFQVNTYTANSQFAPSVAMDADGDFVVSWESYRQDGSGSGIFGQRFTPFPELSISDEIVAEGDSGTTTAGFTARLSFASDQTVTVAYTTADGTATAGDDYLPASGTLTFPPATTTQPISVTVNGDVADEPTVSGPSESFFVNLASPANAMIADGQGQATILNDDAAGSPIPALDPVQGGLITVGATKTLTGANFTAGTRIKLFVNLGSSIDDISGANGFTPTAFTFNTLTWEIPATVPLGQGFGSIFVVNTDQGFTQSNTQYALLYGDPPDNLPTITSIAGTPLSTTLDPGVPVAHTDVVVAALATVAIRGTGFNDPGINLFAATDAGADPAPTATPCAVANYGPFFPGGSSASVQIDLTQSPVGPVPAGPANFQAVNSPYTGNVQSNSVSAVMGARPTISSVALNGSEVQVFGTGFSCLSVINLFNLQGGSTVVNLGGLTGGGQRVIPLQFISASELRFLRPGGAQAGPAFVEVLNPPFIPFSSSGNDPDGAFTLP